jgi:hypothetical protein
MRCRANLPEACKIHRKAWMRGALWVWLSGHVNIDETPTVLTTGPGLMLPC